MRWPKTDKRSGADLCDGGQQRKRAQNNHDIGEPKGEPIKRADRWKGRSQHLYVGSAATKTPEAICFRHAQPRPGALRGDLELACCASVKLTRQMVAMLKSERNESKSGSVRMRPSSSGPARPEARYCLSVRSACVRLPRATSAEARDR